MSAQELELTAIDDKYRELVGTLFQVAVDKAIEKRDADLVTVEFRAGLAIARYMRVEARRLVQESK